MFNRERVALLHRAIELYAITHGEGFRLVSGRNTNYYCTLRNVTQHPDYAAIIGDMLAPTIIAAKAEGVGGMATGAIPIASAVGFAARQLGTTLPGFFTRATPKEHGNPEEMTVSASITDDGIPLIREGRRLAVVEDTMTTGESSWRAVEEVERLGCRVVFVHAIVERHEGGGQTFRDRGIPFKRIFYTDEDGNLYLDEEISKDLA